MPPTPPRPSVAARRYRAWLALETSGGVLLIGAAIVALIWANSPIRESYQDLAAYRIGPEALHLDLSLATWAADGLLAIFFFVVGLELKHEMRIGSLSNPREAAVPMIAAVGGMVMPAAIYMAVVLAQGADDVTRGWAIPTATDIAFALAVLAVAGRGLPLALRTFLLTLAVVDDLLAIIVIALFYTDKLQVDYLFVVLPLLFVFRRVVTSRFARWWTLLPLAVVIWGLMHESGVHATVAGVLLGFCVPVRHVQGEDESRNHRYLELVQPISAGFALPVFAFFAAGVTVVDEGLGAVVSSPIAHGVVLGLVLGKIIGIMVTTTLVVRFTRFRLAQGLGVRDLLPVALLTGIGFTVSLLIAKLSFTATDQVADAKAAVLVASVLAAVLGAIALRYDARQARSDDMNEDGIPDDVCDFIGEPPRS